MGRTIMAGVAVLACGTAAYWEPGSKSADPYHQAMEMSRQGRLDPDALRNDPDFYKRMFGKLATEQGQAQAMDKHQNVPKADICVACHGVVIEIEKIIKERLDRQRHALAVTEALEQVCHLDRYEFQDPVKITNRKEISRDYGGLAPPVMANACKRVVDGWQDDDDEIEAALKQASHPMPFNAATLQHPQR